MQQAELIDSKEKLKELEEAAKEGFARAQFNLGMSRAGKMGRAGFEKALECTKIRQDRQS